MKTKFLFTILLTVGLLQAERDTITISIRDTTLKDAMQGRSPYFTAMLKGSTMDVKYNDTQATSTTTSFRSSGGISYCEQQIVFSFLHTQLNDYVWRGFVHIKPFPGYKFVPDSILVTIPKPTNNIRVLINVAFYARQVPPDTLRDSIVVFVNDTATHEPDLHKFNVHFITGSSLFLDTTMALTDKWVNGYYQPYAILRLTKILYKDTLTTKNVTLWQGRVNLSDVGYIHKISPVNFVDITVKSDSPATPIMVYATDNVTGVYRTKSLPVIVKRNLTGKQFDLLGRASQTKTPGVRVRSTAILVGVI